MAATVLTSPEDVCNAALARIGYKLRIGNMLEGSPASKLFLDIYGQTRDELLRANDWGFAEKITTGTITGSAPSPWAYQYTYPSDCLRLKQVFSPTYTSDTNNPKPQLFRIGSAGTGTASFEAIWSQTQTATLVYTSQVTNPSTWEPMFIEALIEALARRAAPGLAKLDQAGLAAAQGEAQVEAAAEKAAMDVDG